MTARSRSHTSITVRRGKPVRERAEERAEPKTPGR